MKKFTKVFDRNGQEIKIGDRVKILAEECNKFLHDSYGENWLPVMQWDEDKSATVTFCAGGSYCD